MRLPEVPRAVGVVSADGPPRVGDLVHDEVADREGIVTDRSADATGYLLRPVYGTGEWPPEDPKRLTLLRRREQRTDIWAT